MKKYMLFLLVAAMFSACDDNNNVYDLSEYGLVPDTKANSSALMCEALSKVKEKIREKNTKNIAVITLPKGRYDFYQDGAAVREYYVSNHDQTNPKYVAVPLEDFNNVVFDGQGSEFICHGKMLPVSLLNAENCTLKNFSVDFENPHIAQSKVVENDTINGIISFELASWVQYEISDSVLYIKGEGWKDTAEDGIAFDPVTKRLVYRTSDVRLGYKGVYESSPRVITSANWYNPRLVPGTVLAMRTGHRPAPAVFMYHCNNTLLENINIYYVEGMGVLAQVCENITLDGFSVRLRGDNDPRYFSAQADATHFSGCKGQITVINSLYEGMMDDAINVHGVYLRVIDVLDNKTFIGENQQPGSYGFEWGRIGDTVQFITSNTMETVEAINTIASISAYDQPDFNGAKQFKITLSQPYDTTIIKADTTIGIENLTWTPTVYFAKNIVRNNRARGALFSTPKHTLVEDNLFDHTSGAAILLCGDCNGWFETGACHDVVIRNNRFINALTNMFQFTEAVISIYPEIPDLKSQKKYFHSNIVIENNYFKTFDKPIVYAKSVDGLVIKNNTIEQDNDYPAFHNNNHRFLFQRVINDEVQNNKFENTDYDAHKEIVRE